MLSDSQKQGLRSELKKLRVDREIKRVSVSISRKALEKEQSELAKLDNRIEKLLLELAGQQNLF